MKKQSTIQWIQWVNDKWIFAMINLSSVIIFHILNKLMLNQYSQWIYTQWSTSTFSIEHDVDTMKMAQLQNPKRV